MTDLDLIRELRALSSQIELPETTDITHAVRREIATLPEWEPSPHSGWLRTRRAGEPGRTPWHAALRPALVTVAALIAAVALVVASTPAARETIADWLGVGGIGIEIRTSERPDTDTAQDARPTVGDPLPTSDKTTLSAARQAVGYALRVPELLGEPDRVYVDQSLPGGVITMVWAPSDDLPEIGDSDVGLLFSTFRADVEGDFLTKILDSFEDVEPATVDGGRGIWFGGPPHLLARDANGGERQLTARLSAHSLIWERNEITYRIEADLPRDEMVAIGDSLP